MRKFILAVSGILILLKLAVLALGSYPFDFAVFVYQPRSFFEYGVNPLFALNKGLPYLALLYVPYSMYTFLQQALGGIAENVLLLHVIFKLPLLLADLGTGLLIQAIINKFSTSTFFRRYGLLLWLANPLVFWMSEFQGQYAIVAAFFVTLALYLLLVRRRLALSIVSIAVASSIYYYAVMLLPLMILWATFGDKSRGTLLRNSAVGIGSFLASGTCFYLPFLIRPQYLMGLISSLLHHTAPDAPHAFSQIMVPQYSLFRLPFYLLNGQWPSNVTSPMYFKLVSMMTFVGLAIIGTYLAYRTFKTVRSRTYTLPTLLGDCLVVTAVFLTFVGKLQSHYVIWLLPLLLAGSAMLASGWLLQMYGLLSLIPIVVILGTVNLSVFLLDVLPPDALSFFLGHSLYTQSLGGFTVVLILVGCVAYVFGSGRYVLSKEVSAGIAALTAAFFVFAGAFTAHAYQLLRTSPGGQRLASERLVYSYLFDAKDEGRKNVSIKYVPLVAPDLGFEAVNTDKAFTSGYFDSRRSPWYLYNFGSPGSASAWVTKEHKDSGLKALKIQALSYGARAQVNMGTTAYMVPVDAFKMYRVEGALMSTNMDGGEASLSIRFADFTKKIIPGSDIDIAKLDHAQEWARYGADVTVPPSATYAQVLTSLKEKQGEKTAPGANVYADSLAINEKYETATENYTDIRPKSASLGLEEAILTKPSIRDKFNFRVIADEVPAHAAIGAVAMNGCRVTATMEDLGTDKFDYTASFPASCYRANQNNSLSISTKNISSPNIRIALAHIPKYYPVIESFKPIVGVLALTGLLFTCVAAGYLARGYLAAPLLSSRQTADQTAPSGTSSITSQPSKRRAPRVDSIASRRGDEI